MEKKSGPVFEKIFLHFLLIKVIHVCICNCGFAPFLFFFFFFCAVLCSMGNFRSLATDATMSPELGAQILSHWAITF